jgi:hypothetical protein
MSEQHQVATQIGGPVDADLLKEIRILATLQGRRLNILIDEALRDLLKKYRHRYNVPTSPQKKESLPEGTIGSSV